MDKYTNNVSLLEVVEELTITLPKPLPPDIKGVRIEPQLSFVSLWTRSTPDVPESVRTRISVVGPDGSPVAANEIDVDLMDHKRSRLFSRIKHLTFRGPGIYQFVVEQHSDVDSSWSEVARVPLEIKLAESDTPSADSESVSQPA